MKLYPLKFTPILKEKIWGGNKLKSELSKNSVSNSTGESWEISDVDDDVSVISNGELKGTSLKKILTEQKELLLGKKNYKLFGEKFPLLIKFIDAKEDLSIQLHPNNKLAKERHNSFGKTEMWYVMQADDDSNLIVGFNQKMTKEKYLNSLENNSITEILNFDKVKEGDSYFIDVGRIHAIGAGVLLAEIQQTSDITYRVYDWDRVDDNGNPRALHNDLAIDALDFDMPENYRVNYSKNSNESNLMVDCPYFTTNFLPLNSDVVCTNDKDSFLIYVCVDGEITIKNEDFEVIVNKGETVLVPAIVKDYLIVTKYAKLLEVYV